MMLALTHPALLPGVTSSALFWLIGGALVAVSLQLRRLSPVRHAAQPASHPRRELTATVSLLSRE